MTNQTTLDVILFERNLEDNLFDLYDELSSKTYRHQPYTTFHIWDPKFRVIRKASVRDRVTHHLIFRYLEPLFQPRFFYHSYSCQKEKGIHLAVQNVHNALRKVSKNYTKTIWSLKLDVEKFFDSVDHARLLELLEMKVAEPEMRWLIRLVIESYDSPRGKGKGVPIGNLTSQIFANVYLSELDYFVKHTLKVQHYFRYADDVLFLHTDKSALEALQKDVTKFVEKKLLLRIHPQKIIYRKFHQGIDFVGYVFLPYYRVVRTKTRQRMFRKVLKKVEAYNKETLDQEKLNQTLQSYFGLLQHCSANTVQQELQNEVWLHQMRKTEGEV